MPNFDRIYCHGCEATNLVVHGRRTCPSCQSEFIETIIENEGSELASERQEAGLSWNDTYGDGTPDDEDPPEPDIGDIPNRNRRAPGAWPTASSPANANPFNFVPQLRSDMMSSNSTFAQRNPLQPPAPPFGQPQRPTEYPGSAMGESGAWGDRGRRGMTRSPNHGPTLQFGMTFTSTSNGVTTIQSFGNHPQRQATGRQPNEAPDQTGTFGALLHSMIQNLHNSQVQNTSQPGGPRGNETQPVPQLGLTPLLQHIFGMAPNGNLGDFAFSEEALHRFADSLRPPPVARATPQAVIARLPNRKVDKSLLGENGKADCAICIEDCPIGTDIVFLPCQHWFHRPCATMWLKDNDTCPICRASVAEGDTPAVPPARASSEPPTDPTAPLRRESTLGGVSRTGTATRSRDQRPMSQSSLYGATTHQRPDSSASSTPGSIVSTGSSESRRQRIFGNRRRPPPDNLTMADADEMSGGASAVASSSIQSPGSLLRPLTRTGTASRRASQPPAGTDVRDLSPDAQEGLPGYGRQARREEEGARSRFRRWIQR